MKQRVSLIGAVKFIACLCVPDLAEWKDAIYAKIVLKCGDREYWARWARDVAAIAERHVTRIQAVLDDKNSKHAKAFTEFLAGLQNNLNHPSRTLRGTISVALLGLYSLMPITAHAAEHRVFQHLGRGTDQSDYGLGRRHGMGQC